MRIHYIQHASFEKVGVIGSWAKKRGFSLKGTQIYQNESLPSVDDFDFLILMGGPQSPLEMDKYPYLKDEIALIQSAIAHDKRVLGFCLGAQLIGEALGAKTEQSPSKEVGVFPIHLTEAGQQDPVLAGLPESFDVIHWHNDMPGLPKGAELLAYSQGCPRQVFCYGDRVYGFQCHMEITPDIAADLVKNCPGDLKPGKYIQDAEEFLAEDFAGINQKMIMVLDRICAEAVRDQAAS